MGEICVFEVADESPDRHLPYVGSGIADSKARLAHRHPSADNLGTGTGARVGRY